MLNQAKLQLYHRLHEQVNESQERAISFYGKEAESLGLEWKNRTWHHGNIDSVDYSSINIVWEEYHRNCRTDSGRFSMPWEAIADVTYKDYISGLVGEQVAKQNAQKLVEIDREISYKRHQLAKLKAELGE